MNQEHHLARKLIPFLLPLCAACSGGDDGDDTGTPDTSATAWSGKTYLVNIPLRKWTEPKGAVKDFSAYVPPFLLEVNAGPSGSYEVTVATMSVTDADPPVPTEQDGCNLTSTLAGSGTTISIANYPLHIRHTKEDLSANAVVRNLTFTNVLPPGGVAWTAGAEAGSFAGTMDARDIIGLVTLLGEERTPETLCEELLTTTPPSECQPCPHDGAPYCLTLKADEIGAVESGETITPVTSIADACNHGLDF